MHCVSVNVLSILNQNWQCLKYCNKGSPFQFYLKILHFVSLYILSIFLILTSFSTMLFSSSLEGNRQFASFSVFVPHLFKCLVLSQHSSNEV